VQIPAECLPKTGALHAIPCSNVPVTDMVFLVYDILLLPYIAKCKRDGRKVNKMPYLVVTSNSLAIGEDNR